MILVSLPASLLSVWSLGGNLWNHSCPAPPSLFLDKASSSPYCWNHEAFEGTHLDSADRRRCGTGSKRSTFLPSWTVILSTHKPPFSSMTQVQLPFWTSFTEIFQFSNILVVLILGSTPLGCELVTRWTSLALRLASLFHPTIQISKTQYN